MTYVEQLDQTTWDQICALAEHGPLPGQSIAELEALLTKAERITEAARQVTRPRSTTPAKARLQRFVAKRA